jgi:hypothetical protein
MIDMRDDGHVTKRHSRIPGFYGFAGAHSGFAASQQGHAGFA